MTTPAMGGPAISTDAVVTLVEEAVALFGLHAAKEQAKLVGAGRPRSDWHPWAPAFHWFFAIDRARPPILVLPVPMLVARDMRLFQSLTEIYNSRRLRARAIQRIRDQRDSALEELRAAGFYRQAGIAAEWSDITAADTADVLLTEADVEFQMKTRPVVGDAVEEQSAILRLIEKARGQMRGNRPGVAVMAVPGVRDWSPWAVVGTSTPFFERLAGHFTEPRWRKLSAVLMVGEPQIAKRDYGAQMWSPGWLIRNENAADPLPQHIPIWTH